MPMIPLPFGEYTLKAVFAFPFSPGTALPFLPVGDIALDFPHPGVIPVPGLFQILHHHLPLFTGKDRVLGKTLGWNDYDLRHCLGEKISHSPYALNRASITYLW